MTTLPGGDGSRSGLVTSRGAFAQQLAETPQMVEGPFYPDRLPLDTDNDPSAWKTVLVDFERLPASSLGEFAARFDVIIGRTAQEGEDGIMRGGSGKTARFRQLWEAVEAVNKGKQPPPR